MTTLLQLLLLTDDGGAELLNRELRRDYSDVQFARVDTAEDLRQALESPVWDVVIYEQGKLPFDVPTLLACLEKAGRVMPVVIVSGHTGPEVDATSAALKAGVRGYVSKAQLSRLAPAVRRAVRESEVDRERALTEQRVYLFEETVGAIAQGILIADTQVPEFKISYVNRTFEYLIDRPAGELLGRGLRVLHQEGPAPFPLDEIQAALTAGCRAEVEWRHMRRDDSESWLNMSLKPIRDEARRLTHFMAVVTDKSGRRRLEEQLWQAQKMETVGRLTGGLIHDFNNVLTAIRGYSALMLREVEPEGPSRQNLLHIIEAGERAERLARRLTDFSGERPRAPQALPVNAVVEDTLRLLRDLIGEDVELTLALDPVAPVLAEPADLEQVLLNLVLNARAAMPQGGRLIVSTAEVFVGDVLARPDAGAAAGWYVQLAVSDTGCGMSEAVKARLFEPFFTTKGPGEGTGLGLAIVRDVVRQLGGFIEVDSRPGEGATFRLYFPRASRPESATESVQLTLNGDE